MPAYVYQCKNCDNLLEAVHSVNDELHDCESCNSSNCLKKIPQLLTSYSKQKSNKDLAGERVTKAIEDNRKLLLDQKENIKREYKP